MNWMNKKKELRAMDRIFIHTVMFEAGIIPMEDTSMDVSRVLAKLPPEEAKKARRKFRKLWRKQVKIEEAKLKSPTSKRNFARFLGKGNPKPTRAQKNLRKGIVYKKMWVDTIQPLVQLAECPVKEKNADE